MAPPATCDVLIRVHPLPPHHLTTAAVFTLSHFWLLPRLTITVCVTFCPRVTFLSPPQNDTWLTNLNGLLSANTALMHRNLCGNLPKFFFFFPNQLKTHIFPRAEMFYKVSKPLLGLWLSHKDPVINRALKHHVCIRQGPIHRAFLLCHVKLELSLTEPSPLLYSHMSDFIFSPRSVL